MTHGKACSNCAAWEPLRPARVGPVPVGRCRALPPSTTTHWPVTGPTDWCLAFRAEHRERAVEAQERES